LPTLTGDDVRQHFQIAVDDRRHRARSLPASCPAAHHILDDVLEDDFERGLEENTACLSLSGIYPKVWLTVNT
jgi:hypothetical protein